MGIHMTGTGQAVVTLAVKVAKRPADWRWGERTRELFLGKHKDGLERSKASEEL